MSKQLQWALFYCALLLPFLLAAQTPTNSSTSQIVEADVQVTYAEYLGSIPPLRLLVPLSSTGRERRQAAKKNRQTPPNFAGRRKQEIAFPERQQNGPDPLRQFSITKSLKFLVEPKVNILGITSGTAPNDPSGDVGLDHYVQAVNVTDIAVFDKQGNLISEFAANTLWSSIGFSSAGDPIVLYDQAADRWLITEFPNGNQLLVAVSQTSDPLGAWDAYNFATPSFPDYPKYGVWGDAYSVTTNEGGTGTLHAYFIQREALLATQAMVPIQRISLPGINQTQAGFLVGTPVDWTGDTPPASDPLIVALNDSAWGETDEDAIEVYSIKIDWNDPNSTTVTNTTVLTAPYDAYACASPGPGFSCIPQQGGGGLDGIPEVIMNQVIYRNFETHESMVMNFMADVDGNELAGIRWVEMRREGMGDWAVYQEGTYAPEDGLHRFMGGIAMDRSGNIGLAYNVSGPNDFAGVRYTGRRASDPLGQMTIDEYVVVEGESTINSGGRFGDYGHMSVDPVDGRTFWYTTEYAGAQRVETRIVAFEIGRDSTDMVARSLDTPVSAPDLTTTETVTFTVANDGINDITDFKVGFSFEGTFVEEVEVTQTLATGDTYQHAFATTVDLSEIATDYDFELFVTAEGDDFTRNDTLRSVVSNLPRIDAAITAIHTPNGLNCGAELTPAIVLTNMGTDELTNVLIELTLNGTPIAPINWTGSLAAGESVAIDAPLTEAIEGINTLVATATAPNNAADQRPENNSFSTDFEVLLDGVQISLRLNTDEYPEETTWEVEDANGTVILSGGPYEGQAEILIIETWCLDPEACYNFTIFDAFGDGICCGYGQGFYSIVDEAGLPLLNSDGEFASQESNEFCATFNCMMSIDVSVSPESAPGAGDGAILIVTEDGVGPYLYSIDGGNTFVEGAMFTDLSEGDYEVVVQGAANCNSQETVSLVACTLDFSVTFGNASGPNEADGFIEIAAANGTEPYTYSVNNGPSTGIPNFSNLAPGDYEVSVTDANGCGGTETVTVDFNVDVVELGTVGGHIAVYPNPTEGIFKIDILGMPANSVFLPLEVYDAAGKLLYQAQLTQYDGAYTGSLSLYAYPDGVYFIRFKDERVKRMLRIVKQ